MVNKLKITIKQMIMNFQWIARSWTFFIFVGFFCFISFMIPVIFIPVGYSVAILFTLLLIPVNSILFATLNYEFRNSTLRSNMGLSSSSRVTFNLSIFFTMVMVSILSSTFLFIMLSIANHFNLLLTDWFKYGWVSSGEGLYKYKFSPDFYLLVVYATIMLTTVIYAMSFFLNYLIKSKVGYFNILLSLLILTIIFGGAFNAYWWVGATLASMYTKPMFPLNIYWFSVIFPFYNIGELLSNGFAINKVLQTGELVSRGAYYYNAHTTILELVFINKLGFNWNFLMSVPYIEIVTFVGVGALLSKIQRN